MSIDEKLDKIHTKLDSMGDTLLRNTISLELHEKRTQIAEDRITVVEDDLKPLQYTRTFILNIIKFIAVVASILLFCKQIGFLP